MPIFEYNCCHCQHSFETIVLSAREKVSCPKCESSAVEKQLSVFSSRVHNQRKLSPQVVVAARRRLAAAISLNSAASDTWEDRGGSV
jgi:putative FmdB family regulatory protein